MATFTPNLNLKKPATSDLVSIADLNGNMDVLDTAVANKMDADVDEIQATQTGGINKTFTLKATGYKTILRIKDANTYWNTLNGCAYIRCLIRYSTVAQGTTTATSTKMGAWLVDITYSGVNHTVIIHEVNANASNATGALRYCASHAPKNTSYAPQIAVALYDANTTVYITPVILSASEGWEIPETIGGDPGTTNYNRYTVEAGRYNYVWGNNKGAFSITGGCDGTAGSTWDTIRNDRCVFGENAVAGSVMALANDGMMYKLTNTEKEFVLPLMAGRSSGTFTYNGTVTPPTLTNYAQVQWSLRGMAWTELTNTSMQTVAFTVPTLEAGDWGKVLYLTGTLSNGCFKPDGNISFSLVNGKTNIMIGRIDRANQALNTVPTQFTIMGHSRTAYTLDSNGKLTHIDGKEIIDADTYPDELADLGDDSNHRTVTDSEKATWNGKQAQHTALTASIATGDWSNNTATVTATGVTASNTVIVSPAPASITAWGDSGIKCTAQASNQLTFTCEEVPTSAISVNVVILG